MLAPLEDRRVLQKSFDEGRASEALHGDAARDACAAVPGGPDGETPDVRDSRELRDLQRALRATRLRLRRSALQSTRQLMALNAEVSRLQLLCERQAQQIARYAAGAVVMDLGRKLMALSEANERLVEDSRRAAMLERVLGISDAERQRLLRERDAIARELARHRREVLLGTHLTGAAHV